MRKFIVTSLLSTLAGWVWANRTKVTNAVQSVRAGTVKDNGTAVTQDPMVPESPAA